MFIDNPYVHHNYRLCPEASSKLYLVDKVSQEAIIQKRTLIQKTIDMQQYEHNKFMNELYSQKKLPTKIFTNQKDLSVLEMGQYNIRLFLDKE